jgi:hypothetical protein
MKSLSATKPMTPENLAYTLKIKKFRLRKIQMAIERANGLLFNDIAKRFNISSTRVKYCVYQIYWFIHEKHFPADVMPKGKNAFYLPFLMGYLRTVEQEILELEQQK